MGMEEGAGWRIRQIEDRFQEELKDLAKFIGYKIEEELQSLAPKFKNHIIIAEDGYLGLQFHFFKRSAFPDKIHLNHEDWVKDLMHNEVGREHHTLYEARDDDRTIPLLKRLNEIHEWYIKQTVMGYEIQLPDVGVSGDYEEEDYL
jgi:hypothetical protein